MTKQEPNDELSRLNQEENERESRENQKESERINRENQGKQEPKWWEIEFVNEMEKLLEPCYDIPHENLKSFVSKVDHTAREEERQRICEVLEGMKRPEYFKGKLPENYLKLIDIVQSFNSALSDAILKINQTEK
jgi:hypothetical protein